MKWVRDDRAVRVRLEKTHKRGEGSGVMKNGREDQAGRIWRSGAANPLTEPQIFTAIAVEGTSGASWLRNTDSEYKMLNRLAFDLGATPGNTYLNVNGSLTIVSEFTYCASCQGIIQQFNTMFPNINLTLIDGVR